MNKEPHLEQIDFLELYSLTVNRCSYERMMRTRQTKEQARQGYVFAGNVDNTFADDVVARLKKNYAEVKVLTGRAFNGSRLESLSGLYVKDPRITPELVTTEVMKRDSWVKRFYV